MSEHIFNHHNGARIFACTIDRIESPMAVCWQNYRKLTKNNGKWVGEGELVIQTTSSRIAVELFSGYLMDPDKVIVLEVSSCMMKS